jgi:hypothetical protein
MARKLIVHCTKKREELRAVISYHSNEITGDEFVDIMNNFVIRGERTGKIKEGGPPFTRADGKELALLAGVITRRVSPKSVYVL